MEANGSGPKRLYICISCNGKTVEEGDPNHMGCHLVPKINRGAGAPRAGASVRLGARSGRSKPLRRFRTGYAQLDYLLGGATPGFFDREVILFTGEPGCGKSTLTVVLAKRLAERGATVLVATGEESVDDVGNRGARQGTIPRNVHVVATASWQIVRSEADRLRPHVLIVDSVQRLATMHAKGQAGCTAQVEAIGAAAVELAKRSPYGPIVILIGQIIKDGSAAGPMCLLHDVDAHLHGSRDASTGFVVVRSAKNRGGPSGAVSVWRFEGPRLVEVSDWNASLVRDALGTFGVVAFAAKPRSGQCYVVPVEASVSLPRDTGTRVCRATGFPDARLRDLVDALEEHAGLALDGRDVRVAVPEFAQSRVDDPALDFAVCAAVASASKRLRLPPSCVMGAVTTPGARNRARPRRTRGGGGGVRCVARGDVRLVAARRGPGRGVRARGRPRWARPVGPARRNLRPHERRATGSGEGP
jgi:DNA repair protein RadA/Sms